jgi:FkbM family methyltransferase
MPERSAQNNLKTYLWNSLFLLPKSFVSWVFRNKAILAASYGESFAAYQMDLALAKRMPQENGFFIEIGGNDGISQSNTKWFELNKGWRGVLVEPFLPNFRRMTLTRDSKSHLVHGACVPFGYESHEVELTYLDLMTTSDSLESDLLDKSAHISAATGWIRAGGGARKFKAPAVLLNDILQEAKAPPVIDFFSLDVEGAEIPVLRGVDHQRYKFRYLLVESRSPEALDEYLEPLGYEFVEQMAGGDYLYQLAP